MSGSAYGTTGGVGSAYGGSSSEAIFQSLKLVFQVVANALVAPGDTPTADLVRGLTDGTNRVIWTYDTGEGTWKGVQVA